MSKTNPVLSADAVPEELGLDRALRPRCLADYIG